MTAAESKTQPTPAPASSPAAFVPAPFWRKLPVFGTSVGIHVHGPDLRVAVARVRPSRAYNPAAFTIRDFRARPAAEWRAEYERELKNNGISDLAATLLLPRSEVIVRVASFPGVADKDLPAALSLELDTFHPYGDEPVHWAWTRLSPTAVLIGIIRAATLEKYESVFREAGIPVSCITFSASAIHAALRLYNTPPVEFLTWIAYDDDSGEIYGESRARTLFSAEAAASIPNALALGAAELRLPDNAQAVPLDTVLPHVARMPDTLAWAAALAGAASWVAKPANLLPPDRRETVSRGRLIPTFILGACVIAVVIALALQKQIAQRQYLKQLNAEIAQLQPRAARSNAIDRRMATAKARIDLLDRFRARTKDDVEIINELTRLLPPPVWIGTLEIHPDNVVISGEADAAAPLLKALDSSPLFRNSEFVMAVARVGANENFRIKTLRRKPQRPPAFPPCRNAIAARSSFSLSRRSSSADTDTCSRHRPKPSAASTPSRLPSDGSTASATSQPRCPRKNRHSSRSRVNSGHVRKPSSLPGPPHKPRRGFSKSLAASAAPTGSRFAAAIS
jgi:pilus assembly protein HofN